MAKYDATVKETTQKIKNFVEKHGADKMQMSIGAGGDTSSSGLVFLKEVPIGWKPFLGISTKPDSSTTIGQEASGELESLWWNGASTYLSSAHPIKHKNGHNLFPLVMEHNGGWIIASPIAQNPNDTFIPKDAIEMTLTEYAETIGYKRDIPAPSTEDGFKYHAVEQEFPFKPDTDVKSAQEKSLHSIAFNSTSGTFPIPIKKQTFMEKHPWLNKFQ